MNILKDQKSALSLCIGSDPNRPHQNQGILEAYDGMVIPMMELSKESLVKLDNGEAVVYKERDGKLGRGVVVQDIDASPLICMSKLKDLPSYPKMVPNLKRLDVYDTLSFANGTEKVKAKFELGLFGISIKYFLMMTHEPKYNTLTWTLDYSKSSDIEDSVGHWQVMEHPRKNGFSRILYSTKIKLLPWIPEFLISFMTNKALNEATGWLKREAEAEQRRINSLPVSTPPVMVESTTALDESVVDVTAQPVKQNKNTWFGWRGGGTSVPVITAATAADDVQETQSHSATTTQIICHLLEQKQCHSLSMRCLTGVLKKLRITTC